MIQIDREQDIERLRQVATLLDRENLRLHQRLQKLTSEIARLKGQDASALQLELAELQELLAQREQRLFGRSSERRSRGEKATPEEPIAQRGHGPTAQPSLPTLEQLQELPEEKRECSVCGGHLCEMSGQFEESEEITVIQRQFRLVRHRRQKYRCQCNGNVTTAPGPRKLIAGGRYSPEFAVEVAVSKYLDHAPLERQVRAMERQGLQVTSQTLWDQLDALARHLEPTYEALGQQALAASVLHADETRWPMLSKGSVSPWWVWCVLGNETVFYRILGSRSAKAAHSVLQGFHGVVLTDGYGAYQSLARGRPGFTLAHCWAHVRRKFVEAELQYANRCEPALDLIGELFAIEREVPVCNAPEPEEALALRAQLRRERSAPIVAKLQQWAEAETVLPKSSLGKAIRYMGELWPGLVRFLKDPRVPLSNNAAERALRGLVVGRKNHYGSKSRRGTEVAAILYTLCESAKLAGVDPHAYLLHATHQAIDTPGTITLPQQLAAN